MSKKINLSPMQEGEDVRYELTHKAKFMMWCAEHLDEISEMANDYDVEILDKLWPDIMSMLNLNDRQDCSSCEYADMPYDEVDNPCWNCKAGNSEYVRR